jgi:ubiquinol-cytochrome c reductase cytochrome b subunit
MWAAASSDLIATHFQVSLNDVTYWLRALFFVGPILGFIVSKRVSLALQRKDREIALHGRETGRIVRLPHGEFQEMHAQLDDYKRYKLVGYESPVPEDGIPNENGIVTKSEKRRAALSRFFFEDRVAPATRAELTAGHGHHEAIEAGEERRPVSRY